MRVKIQGGTTAGDGQSPLCQTCRYATIVKGPALRDEIVECVSLASGHNRITFPVIRCSSYSDRRQPSLHDMEEIAWILRTDARRTSIGFVRASTLRERERHVLFEDSSGDHTR